MLGLAATPLIGSSSSAVAIADPDAGLLDLARRAQDIGEQVFAADEAFLAAEDQIAKPVPPQALKVRPRDCDLVILAGVRSKTGERLMLKDIEKIRVLRGMMDRQCRIAARAGNLSDPAKENWERVVEIDEAAKAYEAAVEAVNVAAGLPMLEARCALLHETQRRLWRDLARTPARTERGAFAKFAAVARSLAEYRLDNDPLESLTCDEIAGFAAAELVALWSPTRV